MERLSLLACAVSRARRLRYQMTTPVTDSAATTMPIAEMRNSSGQSENAARMHRKLRLNENTPPPFPATVHARRAADRPARHSRKLLSRSYAAGAMIVARPEEAGAVDVIELHVIDGADGVRTSQAASVRLSLCNDVGERKFGRGRLVDQRGRAQTDKGLAYSSIPSSSAAEEHFEIEVEGKGRESDDEQQQPRPEAEGAVNVGN